MKLPLQTICYLSTIFSLFACSDKPEITPSGSLTLAGKETEQVKVGHEASTLMLTIEANQNWILESDQEWIYPTRLSGPATSENHPEEVEIRIDENTGETARTANIRLTVETVSARLEIVQEQPEQPDPIDPAQWESASSAVSHMLVGWNLGNTLDSHGEWIDQYTEGKPSDYETAWGQPVTTPAMIRPFKEAGFNAIRVPVTWYQHMDRQGYVEEKWMKRVEEVVNYVLDADMYCILNLHHDTGVDGWLCADWENYPALSSRYKKLWEQIAARFEKYDQRLLFESYNEILDPKNSWNQTDANGFKAQNALAQDFVNVIRASGGNNRLRNLIINTYCAGATPVILDAFVLPADEVENHLLAQVHVYSPYLFALDENSPVDVFTEDGEKEIDDIMTRLNERFCKNDIPVIVGECGAIDKNNTAERVKQAAYTVKAAKKYGIVCFRWMGLLDRVSLTWSEPEIMEAMIQNAQ